MTRTDARAPRSPRALIALLLALAAGAVGVPAPGVSLAGQAPPPAASPNNPVLPGDYPDPSVIRVGRDYWATATTSQWAPIFPLLHSTDLVNWRLAGAVFEAPPAWSAGSYWAPEIAEDRGRFYVYYTARRKDGPLCVAVATADRPDGPYRDRGPLVCQEVGSIDAMPIRDEHGRRYLVWKEDGNSRKLPTPLWAQPLSEDGTQLTGTPIEILRNEAPWEGHLVEGPFLQRRDGWFYMLYSAGACCGRRCDYRLGVARARALLGPWERHPDNPLLAGNEHWKCPGHGSLVDDGAGRTFLLYHAYDPRDFEYVGRQGLLDEVTWDAAGWPVINGGRGPSRGAAPARPPAAISDDFADAARDPAWQWPWDQREAPVVEPADGGWLRLRVGEGQTLAAAARPTRSGSYVATTVVDVSTMTAGASAGLAAFGNRENALGIGAEPAPDGGVTVTVWRVRKGARTSLANRRLPGGARVHLRLTAADRTRFAFAMSGDGRDWTGIDAEAEGGDLPPWDLSVRVALVVSGPAGASARFGAFTLDSR